MVCMFFIRQSHFTYPEAHFNNCNKLPSICVTNFVQLIKKSLTMKYLIIIIALAAISSGCTKKVYVTPSPLFINQTPYGMWKGKYSLDTNSVPSLDVIVRCDKNGKAFVYNGADTNTATNIGSGYIGYTGFEIVIYYTYDNVNPFIMELMTDANFKTMNGYYTLNGIAGGKVQLTKQ